MKTPSIACAALFALFLGCSSKSPERPRFGSNKDYTAGGTNQPGPGADSNTAMLTKQGALHRLNKREYNATVRDLLSTKLRPADSFPDDPVGSNFDNEGDALSISPTLMKYYYTAATALAEEMAAKDFTAVTQCKTHTDAACLQTYIANFGLRAWRRPLTAEETSTIYAIASTSLTDSVSPAADFIRQTISLFLVSPYFTFRMEMDEAPNSTATRKVNAYELASRLSYFLWSSMPDEELLAAAADNSLLDDKVLSAKVKSMIEDPKAHALTEGFSNIWLETNKAQRVVLDAKLFPKFTPSIRDAMVKETDLFFQDYLKKDLNINSMLSADFTYVNDELAAYYGLPLPSSKTPVRVTLPAGPRRGVLSQGSILTATSTEARTSIVKRGTFILANILCQTPPDLPPGLTIDPLPAVPDANKTTREILADHIASPACAGCHAIIDPPGFALEGFGPDGLARTQERGNPVDSTGSFAGKEFKNATEFAALLQADTKFEECVTRKVFSYALGRSLGTNDDGFVKTLSQENKEAGGRLKALIESVVLSDAFRSR